MIRRVSHGWTMYRHQPGLSDNAGSRRGRLRRSARRLHRRSRPVDGCHSPGSSPPRAPDMGLANSGACEQNDDGASTRLRRTTARGRLAGAWYELGGLLGRQLLEVDLAVLVDLADADPGPEALSAGHHDGSLDDGFWIDSVTQEPPVQAVVVLVVEVGSQIDGRGNHGVPSGDPVGFRTIR